MTKLSGNSISGIRRMNTLLLAIALTLAGAAGTVRAHHSFTATYDEKEEVSIQGTLVQFMFRNPHSFVHVMVEDDTGRTQRWAVEWGAAGTLGRQGVTRESLRPGDTVVITGNPGRNAIDHRLRMQTLRRTTDDYTWGTNPGEDFD